MKLTLNNLAKFCRVTALLVLAATLVVCCQPNPATAQVIIRPSTSVPGVPPPPTSGSTPSSPTPGGAGGAASGPWIPSESLGDNATNNSATNEIQLSFQGANIDMIVQWLSQTTGKSIIKSPQVQCQLTISSSKKVTQREALNLVYRALALEGFSAIEFSNSILIVPEGKEPKMSPELLDSSQKNIPQGRQRLVKVFPLKFVQAADLKDRISTALSDKASVIVDDQANQIIITDYNDNIRAVGDLIEALDTDRPDDVTVRVITLKNASATDLVKGIVALYQKKNSKSPKDTVEVTADDVSNSLLVLSSHSNYRVIQQFVSSLDTEDAQDKITRTFPLKNADAQDVAKQLQELNGDQNNSLSRIIYYSSYAPASSGRTKKISVVADRRRNAVIVQTSPSQMDGIERMIKELDEPVNDGSLAPRIFPLKYANAPDVEEVLNELFLKKQQQRSYYDYIYDANFGPSSQDADVGRLYGKVRITSDASANALIVTANSLENLAAVENIINQLDKPSEAGESTLHVNLKFARASAVANSINIIFAKNGSPPLRPATQQNQPNNNNNNPQQQQQNTSSQSGFALGTEVKEDGYFPWLGGQPDNANSSSGRTARPVSDLVGRVRAVADERTSSLLVTANVHYLPQVLKLIENLDAPTDQVVIEARIVEVSSDFLDKLGVRWSPDGSKVFTADDYDNSLLANVTAQYQKGFGGNTTVNSPSSATVAQALTSLRSGVLSSSINMDFLVQFLRKTTDATVLAEPKINIRDNETGKLFVGQQVPIPNNTQVSSVGSQNTSISYKDVGVVLEVTPHINSSGDVELRIHAESSTVVPGQTVLGGAVFDTRNFRTDLTAKNGETLIVGGIIQKQISDTLRKTPILGSIPGLGWAFKKKDKTTHEVELMVFLRPRVVRSPQDAKNLLREMEDNAPLVKKWEEEARANKADETSKK